MRERRRNDGKNSRYDNCYPHRETQSGGPSSCLGGSLSKYFSTSDGPCVLERGLKLHKVLFLLRLRDGFVGLNRGDLALDLIRWLGRTLCCVLQFQPCARNAADHASRRARHY
jgi:hypothetical protein